MWPEDDTMKPVPVATCTSLCSTRFRNSSTSALTVANTRMKTTESDGWDEGCAEAAAPGDRTMPRTATVGSFIGIRDTLQ